MYAARIENGIVVNVLVGSAEWAADSLGGEWMDLLKKVNVGWVYSDEHGFRPPRPFPSWEWEGGEWTAPVPYPDDEAWYEWDEETLSWATVDLIDGQE